MWKEYMGITFKIPKFTDLNYIHREKFNEFVLLLIKNTYNKLEELHKLSNIVEISQLNKKIKNEIYLKTYKRIFYNDVEKSKNEFFKSNTYFEVQS